MDYEHDDIYLGRTLLDPRFKEVPFSTSSSALDHAKKLILSLMRQETESEAQCHIDNVTMISDDEDAPPKKKCLWDSFEEELRKKNK